MPSRRNPTGRGGTRKWKPTTSMPKRNIVVIKPVLPVPPSRRRDDPGNRANGKNHS